MDETRKFLKKCPTFQCLFEEQWEERAKCISSMVAVYITHKDSRTNEGVFVYCHWWNSVTSKKYGYMWKWVSPETAQLLFTNYSFNDRPIHYLEASVEKDELVEITKHTTYKREPGCTAITVQWFLDHRKECFWHRKIVQMEYTNFIRLKLWRLTISGLVGQNAHTVVEAIQLLTSSNVRILMMTPIFCTWKLPMSRCTQLLSSTSSDASRPCLVSTVFCSWIRTISCFFRVLRCCDGMLFERFGRGDVGSIYLSKTSMISTFGFPFAFFP